MSNNDIYNFARLERSYKTGIDFGYRCVGATAANNHIHNGPHAGMIFYGVNNDIYGNELDNLVTEFQRYGRSVLQQFKLSLGTR